MTHICHFGHLSYAYFVVKLMSFPKSEDTSFLLYYIVYGKVEKRKLVKITLEIYAMFSRDGVEGRMMRNASCFVVLFYFVNN